MRRAACLGCLLVLVVSARAVTPAGIVYEAERIAREPDAWRLNERTTDRWMLWTTEDDIDAKRSGGAVLASPVIAADRERPADGAPPLHCVVDDLPPGLYRVYASNPGRPLGYSRDGAAWFKHGGSELDLGQVDVDDGRFELWVDDRYAHPPGNPGPGYFDYLRFVPLPAGARHIQRLDGARTDESWAEREPGRRLIPAARLTADGFTPAGDVVAADGPPASLEYAFDSAGTVHAALRMIDRVDAVETVRVLLGEREVGVIVADGTREQPVLFSLTAPLSVRAGDRLRFVCDAPAAYRVAALYLSPTPIVEPPLRFEHVVARCVEPGAVQVCWTTSRPVATGTVTLRGGPAPVSTVRDPYLGRNHQAWLVGLAPDTAYTASIETEDAGATRTSPAFTVRARPPRPPASAPLDLLVRVPEPTRRPRTNWPITQGVPFARGRLAEVRDLRLFGADGRAVPLQAEVFSRWPDGSVQWATLTFLGDTDAGYRLRTAATASPLAPDWFTIEDTPAGWEIRGDRLAFRVPKPLPALFANVGHDRNGDGRVADDERVAAAPIGANVKLETPDGRFLTLGPPDLFAVESAGANRAVLRWQGPLRATDGSGGFWYLVRVTLWRGRALLGVNLSIGADGPQPAFSQLRSLALRLPLDGDGRLLGALEAEPLTAIPDADGLWIHQDFDDRVTLRDADGETTLATALGVATATDGRTRATVAQRDFSRTYPSGFAVKPDGLHIRLLPALRPDQYLDETSRPLWPALYSWCRDGNYQMRAGQVTQDELLVEYSTDAGAPDPAAFAAWCDHPPTAELDPAYLLGTGVLGRPLTPRRRGHWDAYERYFSAGFEATERDRAERRTWGWLHYGDWFGERILNYGNNEYDLAWTMGVAWMRSGERRWFDRGWQMARHHSTVDTLHGPWTNGLNGVVWEHSFGHVGSDLKADDPRLGPAVAGYVERYGAGFLSGAIDRQGHVYQEGNWLYAALTGDPWLRETAERVCLNQATRLTSAFDFGIERSGGWPLANMVAAYRTSGDPYYLNAARIMVERCLERQDPETGGWLHTPPVSETNGEVVRGGKAFAVGILGGALLRYLDVEPTPRPDVERMLVRGADWLMNESWNPGRGFRYISRAANYRDTGDRGVVSMLNAELVAFAYERTRDAKYLMFWREMTAGVFDGAPSGNGKSFTMATRQTIFGLERIAPFGVNEAPAP